MLMTTCCIDPTACRADILSPPLSVCTGMFFTLPVLLLSMRLLVHTLFTSLFPCWMKTPDGKAALRDGVHRCPAV